MTKTTLEQTDPVTAIIGECGKWQLQKIGLVLLCGFSTAWQILATTFLTPKTDYYCITNYRPDLFQNLSSWNEFINPTKKDGTLDKCNMYKLNYDSPSLEEDIGNAFNGSVLSGGKTEPCTSWEFDLSFYKETVQSRFTLVCDTDYLVTLFQVIYMVGVLFGVIVFGYLSDRFGRVMILRISSTFLAISSIGLAFAPYISLIMALRFVIGFTTVSVFTTGFVYCMELVSGKWNTFIGMGLEVPWALAYVALPGIAYLLPEWWKLQLAISAGNIVLPIIFWVLPESPKWLLTTNQKDKAIVILREAVRVNGRDVDPEEILKTFEIEKKSKKDIDNQEEDDSLPLRKQLFGLCTTGPNLLMTTLIQYYLWFTNSFVYYGLALNSDSIFTIKNLHLNFFISGLVEFPAYSITTICLFYVGRKYPLVLNMLLSGIFFLLTLAVTDGLYITIFSNISKFGITCSFAIIYIYAAELYPTELRNFGIGTSSKFARLATIIAPFIARSLDNNKITITIFGICAVTSGLLGLLLPETKGKILPNTLEEAENFGKKKTNS